MHPTLKSYPVPGECSSLSEGQEERRGRLTLPITKMNKTKPSRAKHPAPHNCLNNATGFEKVEKSLYLHGSFSGAPVLVRGSGPGREDAAEGGIASWFPMHGRKEFLLLLNAAPEATCTADIEM